MRYVVMAVLAGLCGLMGWIGAQVLWRRVNSIECLIESLRRLKIEIGFTATPLPKAALKIAHGELEWFWLAFGQKLDQGLDACNAYEQLHNSISEQLGQDATLLLQNFMQSLGKSDRATQCIRIEETVVSLQNELFKARKNASEKGKVRTMLGMFAGIALVVVLI